MLKAHVTIVPDVKAPGKCEARGAAKLLMRAVGLGKIMIAETDCHGAKLWAGPKATRYQPQAKVSSIILVVGPNVQTHPSLMRALRCCSKGGKCSVVRERPAPAKPGSKSVGPTVEWLDDLHAVRRSLFKQRSIFRRKGADGKFPKTYSDGRAA